MTLRRALGIVFANVRRNKRAFLMSSFGLVVGVATFVFFVALGMGIQSGVINRIYPVNQIEVEPATVGVIGLRQGVVDAERLGPEMVRTLGGLPDVTAVYPKMRSKLQARLWGGKAMFGYDMRTEAFFDGLDPELLHAGLAEMERVEDKRARDALRPQEPCLRDEECPLGQECVAPPSGDGPGACRRVEYWRRFQYSGSEVPCESDDSCAPGLSCVAGFCATGCGESAGEDAVAQVCSDGDVCVAGACREGCERDGDCAGGHVCVAAAAGQPAHCERLACTISNPDLQWSDRPRDALGRVVGRCANGVDPGSPDCEPMGCPDGTYCAVTWVRAKEGFCEDPLPVLLNPFLIEVFNSSVASSLGLQPLDGTAAILGVRFRMHLGGSFFTASLPERQQAVRQAEIVGFSNKALDFGVTLPIEYVRRFNARFKGRDAARTYGTFILETRGNEDVSELIGELDTRGFALSSRSQDARKAADMLFILTLVFSFISIVIMGVAGVNISHTFMMIVMERRHEIGIMRAIGATRMDIRKMVLGEAALIGVFGAAIGEALAYGGSRLANLAADQFLGRVPFKPDDFFVFDWRVLVGAVFFALFFCLAGAVVPSNRAARLDPARVLVS